jgi:hypothetical protein
VARLFHVTSVHNRASIAEHGLDWTRMSAARDTGGPVDVWAVDDVDEAQLLTSPEGYQYLPQRISPDRPTLVRRDISPLPACDTG